MITKTSGTGTKLAIRDVRASVAIGGKADNICSLEFFSHIDLTSPPSIRSAAPVIQRAAGETRKAMSSASSSGVPCWLMPASRRNGCVASSGYARATRSWLA